MKTKKNNRKDHKILTFIIALIIAGGCHAQNIYNVGTSRVSIEPKNDLISLALGGYAAPWEGRFTLHWKKTDRIPHFTAITGVGDILFIINDGYLLRKKIEANAKWEKITKTDNIKFLSGSKNLLLAVTLNGDLLLAKVNESNFKWNKINSIGIPIRTITVYRDVVYLADKKGNIWTCDISKKNSRLIKTDIEPLNTVIKLSANNKKLLALTEDGVIYQYVGKEFGNRWIKIAYKNNVTIKEDIHDFVMINNSIYGIDANNILYSGEHRSEGNLSAQAISINDGESTVIIIGLDVVGLDFSFTQLVKEEIFQNTGISPSAVFINSSHTHFAPVSQNWLPWQESNRHPDSTYLFETIKKAILDVVSESLENALPAEIYFGRGKTDIGYNRSLKDNPEIYDNDLDVIKVNYIDSKKVSCLFLAACHPVFSTAGTLHYTISSNYPGVARELVEKRTGSSFSLFLQGTTGDINPVDNGHYITGEKLANEVIAILQLPMEKISGTISHYLDQIDIPIQPKSTEEILEFKEQNMATTQDMISERNINWSNIMLQYYDNGTMPISLPVYIQTLNIGNWKLIGFSRETTSEYSLEVKKMYPFKLISVAGFTNDVSSYLPTNLHIEKKNYEGFDSFYWYGMPNTFPDTVKETILSFVKKQNR